MAKAMKIVTGLAVLLLAFGIGLAVPRSGNGNAQYAMRNPFDPAQGRPQIAVDDGLAGQTSAAKTVSLMLDYGDGEVRTFSYLPWQEGMSVYQALQSAAQANGVEIKSKDYGGDLGVFIEAIGGRANSGNAYWQFWVNNAYSKVGSSSYKLQAGDSIMWKLIKGQL